MQALSTTRADSRASGGRRRRGRDLNGILLLDKPSGISSNQALQRAKGIFRARKAGHTGNLDVLATGLLPVCFGEATKVCAFLLDADKSYASEFLLGVTTTTADAEGEVISRRPAGEIDAARVAAVLARFRGVISQIPPMYSALKRNGQPLYKLARQGIEVDREARQVTIHRLDLRYLHGDRLGVEIDCSKGTYIRTLAEDIGEELGCGAHVASLRRLRAGPYSVDGAYSLEWLDSRARRLDSNEDEAEEKEREIDDILLPLDSALTGLPSLSLSEDTAFYLLRGQAVQVPRAPSAGLVRLYGSGAAFLGVGQVLEDGRVAPRRLIRASH
jgi:tRNA pseudouridine55 synthase